MDIIQNINLFNDIDKYDVILIGTNIYNTLSQGFQRDIMLHYPFVHETNLRTNYGDRRKLGTIKECNTGQPLFSLCFITKSMNFRPDIEKDYLDYDALERCLKLACVLYKGKKIATTLIGGSRFDGNGDKDKILTIIKNTCKDIDITIYDYYQLSKQEKKKLEYKEEQLLKKTDYKKYREVVSERKKRENKIKSLNGHSKY